jgi:RNA polymerase sigma factor (TIGR02999 family)
MNEVTRILSAIEQGDAHAAEQLLPLVYQELRKLATERMAHEKPGQTLEATALVHEAYLRLVDTEKAQHWDSRSHFFASAAEAMRRVLAENARRKKALLRGGNPQRLNLDLVEPPVPRPSAGAKGDRAHLRSLGAKKYPAPFASDSEAPTFNTMSPDP